MNHLLQVNPTIIDKGSNQLFQYGVLGIFAILMISVIWYLEKQRTKRDDENKAEKAEMVKRMTVLETKLEEMQEDLIRKMESIIIENSKVMSKNIEVMEEVKELLIKKSV